MPSLDSLTRLVHKLRRATSLPQIGQALLGEAQAFSFEHLIIAVPRAGGASASFATTHIDGRTIGEWLERAQRCELPIVVSAPFDRFNGVYSTGLVIPVHEGDRLAWCACPLGFAPDLSSRAKLILGAAAYAAHARQQTVATDKKSLDWGLSAREQACLDFVTLGKTDVEIGRILQISPRTVRFHVQNGKVKLGVTTRIQAAAILSANEARFENAHT